MNIYLTCLLFLILFLLHDCQTKSVNVALKKPINAKVTCGTVTGEEPFYVHAQIFEPTWKRKVYTCVNGSQYPPDTMVDGLVDTWWQSTSRSRLISLGYGKDGKEIGEITIDLEQEFEINSISLQMGDSLRPKLMSVKKSTDGVTYKSWLHKVTVRDSDCPEKFPTAILSDIPSNLFSILCQQYILDKPVTNEIIKFDLSVVPTNLAAFKKARYLKILFYTMEYTLGLTGDRFQHFTVKELTVMAECVCNGLGTDCVKSNNTGRFECICGGNSEGRFCNKCKPFYNQRKFQYGKTCEACVCNKHSEACYFNETVNALNMSKDATGKMSGGGTCIDCQHNTTGVNCEKCINFFYRPLGIHQNSPSACKKCSCHGPGVTLNPETGLVGDCIMNDDKPLPSGKKPGDCICKKNVQGTTCDQCKPGFFNLTSDNPNGCQDCFCNPSGTLGGTTVCLTNATGSCPCKKNVMNRRCDECLDGFYGLNETKADGCTICDCDAGGSSSSTCRKSDGQCPCRKNVDDRQCKSVIQQTFYPGAHYFSYQFEDEKGMWDRVQSGFSGIGYALVNVNNSAKANFKIPENKLSGVYIVLIKYVSTLHATGKLSISILAGANQMISLTFNQCSKDWCIIKAESNDRENVTLAPNIPYTATISINEDHNVFFDEIIILPEEFFKTEKLLGVDNSKKFSSTCNIIKNDLKLNSPTDGPFCKSQIFSLWTNYLDGALPCDCHPEGSFNNTCSNFEGQCHCKPGVGGRRCDECLAEFYGLDKDGSCDCKGKSTVCDRKTGQCVCQPNSSGRQCEKCLDNYYDWTADKGCQDCKCDVRGSLTLQCNITSGICDCKSGVFGEKCDTCAEKYKLFSSSGCSSCNCDMQGSTNAVCNDTTGQCPCKKNTGGLVCDVCNESSFYNDVSHKYGCLSCVCMGVSKNCKSTVWNNVLITMPASSSSFEGGVLKHNPNYNLRTETTVQDINFTFPIAPDSGIRLQQTDVSGTESLYWQPKKQLIGNLLTMYENKIYFDVYYKELETGGKNKDLSVLLLGRKNDKYVFNIDPIDGGTLTRLNFTLSEAAANQKNGKDIEREQFLLALTDVQAVLLPAVFNDKKHSSGIGNLKFERADPLGFSGRSLGVEKCSCPKGYEGLSCEKCSEGYKRENVTTQGFLGFCVPCECNGHSSKCNADTGVCESCLHDTDGDRCEICKLGFYGNATNGTPNDCKKCPCHEPRVRNDTCQLVNNNPVCSFCNEGYSGDLCDKCENFYFGNPEVINKGSCKKCFCNGNAESCDKVTGACLNCTKNTIGKQCERCQDGTYGNATVPDCKACNCDEKGSNSTVCHHFTGQCPCKPGVGERTCSKCLTDYYGFTNTSFVGCVPCNCNSAGSQTGQCNDDGICTCKDGNTEGIKCDSCKNNFWGLPKQACSACQCDITGSVDSTKPCDKVSGQCDCKEGVASRRCNECKPLYVNFGATGCTRCGDCSFALGNDTNRLTDSYKDYWNTSQGVGKLQDEDISLQSLSAEVNSTIKSLGISGNQLDVLEKKVTNLTTAEPLYNSTMKNFETDIESLHFKTGKLLNDSLEEKSRINSFKNQSNFAWTKARTANNIAKSLVTQVDNWNKTAHGYLLLGNQVSNRVNNTFTKEREEISKTQAKIDATVAIANSYSNKVDVLKNKTAELNKDLIDKESNFKKLKSETEVIRGQGMTLNNTVNDVFTTINATLQNRQAAIDLFEEGIKIFDLCDKILDDGQKEYTDGKQALDDVNIAISGSATKLPLTSNMDLSGIENYEKGALKLEVKINDSISKIDDFDKLFSSVRVVADALKSNATRISETFKSVETRGERAVKAINDYEEVIKKLNESTNMALEANTTLKDTLDELSKVSAEDLQKQATTEKTASENLKKSVEANSNLNTQLNNDITRSRAALKSTEQEWNNLQPSIKDYNNKIDTLVKTTSDTKVGEDSSKFSVTANNIIRSSQVILAEDLIIAKNVQVEREKVTTLEEAIKNSTTKEEIKNYKSDLDTKQKTIKEIEAVKTLTNTTKYDVESRLSALEVKVNEARLLLGKLEQPVNFETDDYVEAVNPDAAKNNLRFNEIYLKFRFENFPKGVIFFVENKKNKEKLLLQIVNQQLMFAVHNDVSEVKVISPTTLCTGCWFRVIATRYTKYCQLSITKLDTGGVAVHHEELSGSKETMTLDGNIYVAGLPTSMITTKIDNSTRGYKGCIHELSYNNKPISLWNSILSNENQTLKCCGQPPIPPSAPTETGTSFGGFGMLRTESSSLDVSQLSRISFEFITWDSQGTILLVDDSNSTQYYGLFINDGNIIYEFGNSADSKSVTSLKSSKKYNDGMWYELEIMHNTTYAVLTIAKVNKTLDPSMDVKSSSNLPLGDLKDLSKNDITIGGQNSNTTQTKGPVTDSFAGAIRQFQHNVGNNLKLVPRVLKERVIESSNVFHSIFDLLTKGLWFNGPKAAASIILSSTQRFVKEIEFEFITFQPSGILLYGPGTSRSFFYIAIYNGDLFLQFEQSRGRQAPLRSRGKYLSEGIFHRVVINFEFENSPKMTIDGETHHGAITMTPTMTLDSPNIRLHAGGPFGIELPNDLPVTNNYIGGISNLKINKQSIDFLSSAVLKKSLQNNVFLSGVPGSLETLPPLPYVTTPAPPTTPKPTCAIPKQTPGKVIDGVNFGQESVSYLSFDLKGNYANALRSSFTIAVEFRALEPDGLILYAADQVPNPRMYVAIYMHSGYIYVSIDSDTPTSNSVGSNGHSPTKLLKSKNKYNNGKWEELTVLRIADFMALIIPDSKDYTNNRINAVGNAFIDIKTPLYLGGVPQSVVGSPFNSNKDIIIGTIPFKGCIRKLTVSTNENTIPFNLVSPTDKKGTNKCYEQVMAGTFYNATNAYAMIGDSTTNTFDIGIRGRNFNFTVTFLSTALNGTLVVSYGTSQQYFLIDINNGAVRVSLGNSQNVDKPFEYIIQDSITNGKYSVCNNQEHRLMVDVTSEGIVTQFDAKPPVATKYPAGFTIPILNKSVLYLAGLKNPNWIFPIKTHGESFTGCISNVYVNDRSFAMSHSSDKKGLESGCPSF
ncbi:DgyrCDS12560 [Dimorphilus gyrociliatus]|uniref:DgyrCDS12560 n=1 Tax=Dimorphilus gyrociliatus TaxID=2664684 RepID=A0A7I8W6U4_9ANNE|nr:DgyrCDS12560 [Dimorphilus gyrociliatus]